MLIYTLLTISLLGFLTPSAAARHSNSGISSSVDVIPPLGLGTWLSSRDKVIESPYLDFVWVEAELRDLQVTHAVEYALKIGYRHIDAASAYRNEKEVGKGIVKSGVDRGDIWVTSKLWNTDHRPEEAREAIETTIKDLGVDYLDLYLVHWPVAFKPNLRKNKLDHKTTLLDTWRALEGLVREGKTRYIGISNFAPADVDFILAECEICPYAHEFEAHPYLQQKDWVDWHLQRDVKVIAYSPLANTNPTYHPPKNLPPILHDSFWKDLAEQKNVTIAQAILAWGIQRGTVVIPKSVHEKYIEDDKGGLDVGFIFTEEEMGQIAEKDRKTRMNDPGKSWGVDLFKGLDDPTRLHGDDEGLEL